MELALVTSSLGIQGSDDQVLDAQRLDVLCADESPTNRSQSDSSCCLSTLKHREDNHSRNPDVVVDCLGEVLRMKKKKSTPS